jgi:IclR family acetate operon transcriptional repressor
MNLITAEDTDLGIRVIARRTGIHSATVHRIVSTLEGAGLLQQDASSALYRTGPRAFTWGTGFLNRSDLRQLALPHMRALRDRFDETVALSVHSGRHRVYLEQLPSNRGVRTTIQIGSPYDIFSGAAGAALLSTLSEADLDSIMHLVELPSDRAADIRQLAAEVRSRGYATSQQQVLTGVSAISAPITDIIGAAWAISVLGPSVRLDALIEEIGCAVVEAADEVSRAAGGDARR